LDVVAGRRLDGQRQRRLVVHAHHAHGGGALRIA
jgi:hypothetical protein